MKPHALAASLLLLVPCWWQPRIQAGDFSSHVYNAWLVQLIKAGSVEGLSLVPQKTNILADLLLSLLVEVAGFDSAQKLTASLLVLTFFWGAFAFVRAVSGRAPWFLAPCLAMLAYGWVFHMGFSNFYLSLGLTLWALALAWNSGWLRALAALPLALAAAAAHLLPLAWAAGVLLYAYPARRVPDRTRMLLGGAVLVAIVVLHFILTARYPAMWTLHQAFAITGADQVWVYGVKYFAVSVGLLLLWGVVFLRSVESGGEKRTLLAVPFQIYLLTAAGILLIPVRIHLPGYEHALVYISHRMSLAAAVLLCAALASVRPPKAVTAGFAALAVLFFSFLYADSRALNRMEDQMESVLQRLEPEQRVVSALCEPGVRVDPLAHMVDRACVGRCFSYANYEPSTAQFRVRAAPGNPVVVSSYADSWALQTGKYMVTERDLPLFEVCFCDEEARRLCGKELKAGELSGRTCKAVLPKLW